MPDAATSSSFSRLALPEIRSWTIFSRSYIYPLCFPSRDSEADSVLQWDSVEKSAIQERKIRVNWLPAFSQENGQSNPAVTPVRHSLANGVCVPQSQTAN